MKTIEAQLLESLGHGVRPFDTGQVAIAPPGVDFDQMLSDIGRGAPVTELGVRFAPSVSGMFESADQFAIARGVDRAAAAGVDHALILHDQRTLRVDVRNRIVLEAVPIADERVIDGIDGFVSLDMHKKKDDSSDSDTPDIPAGGISTPARIVRNASLIHALAGRVPD